MRNFGELDFWMWIKTTLRLVVIDFSLSLFSSFTELFHSAHSMFLRRNWEITWRMKPLYYISYVCPWDTRLKQHSHTHGLSYSKKTTWTVVGLSMSLVTDLSHLVTYKSNLCTGQVQPKKITELISGNDTHPDWDPARRSVTLSPALPCFACDHK